MFWRSTPREIVALHQAFGKRENDITRRASLRAGLIAATILNVNRRKGGKTFKPSDFVREQPRELSLEGKLAILRLWASDHNASIKRKPQ